MSCSRGTPQEVIGGEDFSTFDSTLQSEKGFIAQSLQELLVAVINNPVAAQQLDIDPEGDAGGDSVFEGVGNVGRFSLSQRVASGQVPPLPPAVLPWPPGRSTTTTSRSAGCCRVSYG